MELSAGVALDFGESAQQSPNSRIRLPTRRGNADRWYVLPRGWQVRVQLVATMAHRAGVAPRSGPDVLQSPNPHFPRKRPLGDCMDGPARPAPLFSPSPASQDSGPVHLGDRPESSGRFSMGNRSLPMGRATFQTWIRPFSLGAE
jgi:hypothetical protein